MQAQSRRLPPADYFAMKQRVVRHARAAQAAAIRDAFAYLIAAAVTLATRPFLPFPKPNHGD
jgi:hypothetical protein